MADQPPSKIVAPQKSRWDWLLSFRWYWLLSVAGLGVVLILLAGYLPWNSRSQWGMVGSSLLVNLGAALEVSAVFVVLQPRFTRAARSFLKNEIKNETAPLKSEVEELGRSVQSLADRTSEVLRFRDERIDRAVAAVDESPTFESVAHALALANDLNALGTGIATVQAGTDDDGDEVPFSLRVRFLWGGDLGAKPSLQIQAVCSQDIYITSHLGELGIAGAKANNNDHMCSDLVWTPGEKAEEVGARLISEVQRQGVYFSGKTLNWGDTMIELRRSLQVAVSSVRGDPGAWRLYGRLLELVGDWAITTRGVEHRGYDGLVFEPEDFPPWYPVDGEPEVAESTADDILGEISSWKRPQSPPPGLPPADERLRARACAHLPLRNSPNTPPGWIKATASDDQRSPK